MWSDDFSFISIFLFELNLWFEVVGVELESIEIKNSGKL